LTIHRKNINTKIEIRMARKTSQDGNKNPCRRGFRSDTENQTWRVRRIRDVAPEWSWKMLFWGTGYNDAVPTAPGDVF
jgi:hypothetical protein